MNTRSASPFRRGMAFLLIGLMLIHLSACAYFKVRQGTSENVVKMIRPGRIQKHFFLHRGDATVYITDLKVEDDAFVATLSTDRTPFYVENRRKRYENREKDIINEVHIYADSASLTKGILRIPMDDLQEVRIIRSNDVLTLANFAGVTVGGLGLIAAIGLATKSFCPYVYVHDGNDFVFEGEMYAGALLKNLEQDDYIPLPRIRPVDHQFKIWITNELHERQFTNLAELVVVNHRSGALVLPDQRGTPHLIQQARLPVAARNAAGQDITPELAAMDQSIYFFDETGTKENAAILTFEKPAAAREAKLVINARNTFWFDWLLSQFGKRLGSDYQRWMEQQEKTPGEEIRQFMLEQEFPLTVSLKTDQGWQVMEHLSVIGPMAGRNLVVPLDLSQVQGREVRIKLQTGFMFWEVDYAALDYSGGEVLETQVLQPQLAMSSDGGDHTADLAADDDRYLVQRRIGTVTEVHFDAPPVPAGMQQTVFLHARGYHRPMRDHNGTPDFTDLQRFSQPAYFSTFSKEQYEQMTAGRWK